ncbi:MAG: diguanylate cyclase (GGDEF)-like protein/PAS domain S-box-containing protein [Alteromonadaceae bacterium]|jgi:diguanylate cyclase (GGDEF)-like protein/PAS domain S-box-containing protein
MIAAVFMLESEYQQLVDTEEKLISSTSQRYAKLFEKLIQEKVSLGVAANNVVTETLSENLKVPKKTSRVLKMPDTTYRADDGYSGAFMTSEYYSAQNQSIFPLTAQLWKTLAPTVTQGFFNFYLITKQQFIRITPKDWALEVEADHNFEKDLFYSIATPQSNPDRKPVWTPVYYDNIWEKWMTSLIVPIYVNGKFFGVTGSDFVLDEIFDRFQHLSEVESGREAFLFDATGNILAHPQLMDQILLQAGDMEARLQSGDLLSDGVHALMEQMIHTHPSQLASGYEDELGQKFVINIRPINGMGWYLGVYNSEKNILKHYQALKTKLIIIFVVVAFMVALLLQQIVYQIGLKRIRELMQAVRYVAQGGWSFDLPEYKNDEIGALGQAFHTMTTEINKLVEGLNQKIHEKEVAELSANKLSKAVSFSGSGILITDEHLQIEYVNPKLCEMSGFDEAFFVGKPLFNMISHEMEFLADDIKEDLKLREHWRGDILLINRDQKDLWSSLSISPILQEDRTITNYVCSAQDISFVKESQKKMEQLAYFDVLTGLANRTFFKMQLRKALALSKRGHYSFALFYFDLDEFKRINDTLGHDAGDSLLIEVANRLTVRLRTEDTIARLGGDEFAVLLSGIKDKEEAKSIIETIETMLIQPIKLGNNEVIISASIGVTMAPYDSMEEDTLLKHADLAMYEAKEKGKNTSHFYTKDLDAAARERMVIENELRVAIKEKQLLLYFQPQVDIDDLSVVGFEALIRWLHPQKGMISPARFIPVAENTGQVVEIGEWVLWEACRFLAKLQLDGYTGKLSVNISSRQLKDINMVGLLERVIQETGINPSKLDLEITESMLMGDVDGAIRQLYDFKKLGVALSIDDFGTGYSSLSYLKRFPVDTLKIDRSFIKDIPQDRDDMEISSAIIAMAQKLNLKLVAEGVETEAQIEFLRKNNCCVIQGYYFSQPLPPEKVAEFLVQFKKNWADA